MLLVELSAGSVDVERFVWMLYNYMELMRCNVTT